MLTNADSKLSPPSAAATREEALHRPLLIQKSANGTLVTGLGAAYAFKLIDDWYKPCGPAEVRTMKNVKLATRVYFGALGVSFDASGRPLVPGMVVDISSVGRMHAEAAELAYLAIRAAVYGGVTAAEEVDQWAADLAGHALFSAIRDGAPLDVTLGQWKLKREVHALDRATGECLGHLGLFR